ncbi:hypothetical protein OHT77_01020 [Streptomyces sp. NBC_00252]|uniref:hypothetical protein n=1 Tax=Streptomyces sp. NBC_00252 TaxID=2975691 RepID=UPI002E2A2663|nr:hypothetical protein [Streptomyces sp. NBC_00252]
MTGKARDAYFCALAARVTTAARIRCEGLPVKRLARQHTEILRLADKPHLSDRWDTIDPYCVWITYRLEVGATEPTWEAVVSGYRVLSNGVIDMDARSITLRSGTDEGATPDWLTGLIEQYTPASW